MILVFAVIIILANIDYLERWAEWSGSSAMGYLRSQPNFVVRPSVLIRALQRNRNSRRLDR